MLPILLKLLFQFDFYIFQPEVVGIDAMYDTLGKSLDTGTSTFNINEAAAPISLLQTLK